MNGRRARERRLAELRAELTADYELVLAVDSIELVRRPLADLPALVEQHQGEWELVGPPYLVTSTSKMRVTVERVRPAGCDCGAAGGAHEVWCVEA